MFNSLKTALLLSLTLGGTSALAAMPPVEAFGRKPAMVDVDINPAGTLLASIADENDTAHVVIHDLAANKMMRDIAVAASAKLWSVRWADDDTLLIEQTVTHTVDVDYKLTQEY